MLLAQAPPDEYGDNVIIKSPIRSDDTRLNYYCDEQAPLVDAYSLGRLLRYMLTGVPPDKSVMDALEEQSGMIGACFCLGRRARLSSYHFPAVPSPL